MLTISCSISFHFFKKGYRLSYIITYHLKYMLFKYSTLDNDYLTYTKLKIIKYFIVLLKKEEITKFRIKKRILY